jgi:hypothetical protein
MNLAFVNLASVLRDVSPASTKTFYTSLRSDVFDVLSLSTLSDTDKAALGRCFDALPDPDTIGHADVAFFEDVLTRFSANMTSAKLADSFVVRVNDRNGFVELPAEALAWTDADGNLVARPRLAPDVSVASGEALAAAPEGRKRKAPPPVRIVLDDEAADGEDDDDDSDDESSSSSSGDVDDESSSDSPLEFAEATVGKKFVEKLSEPKFNIPRSLADLITAEWRSFKADRMNVAPNKERKKQHTVLLLVGLQDLPVSGGHASERPLVAACRAGDTVVLGARPDLHASPRASPARGVRRGGYPVVRLGGTGRGRGAGSNSGSGLPLVRQDALAQQRAPQDVCIDTGRRCARGAAGQTACVQ